MTILDILLWLLGGLAAVVLLCFAALWMEKAFPGKSYDERQMKARGNGYRLGFFVGLLWMFGCAAYLTFTENSENMALLLFLGFMTQTLTFHIYCLATHAALPMSEKPLTAILSYGILAVFDGVNVVLASQIDQRWPEKPQVNTWIQLSMAVGFGALSIMHLIQYLRDRKE